ncbi:MAG: SlyX family protein [Paracoccaceae bacterium]|jgi:SlyX protein|nr:SlyX family protein [Paracoccaceae bacterium]
MDDTRVEEELAHLRRTCDDLSEMVARQEREIARLSARVTLLMERAAAQEQEGTGGAVFAETPPHW